MKRTISLVTGFVLLVLCDECIAVEWYTQANTTFDRILQDLKTLHFCSYALAQRFTKTGFLVSAFPTDLKQRLREFYAYARNAQLKRFEPKSEFIWKHPAERSNGSQIFLNILDIEHDQVLKHDVETEVRKMLAQWTGVKDLQHTATYGIREYSRGSVLKPHVDRYRTHVLSAIINVHQESEEPWALVIFDHNNQRHHLYLNDTLDVVLYESTTVIHGRPYPFQGDSFGNLFSHFAPIGWGRSVASTVDLCLEGTRRVCHDEQDTCANARFEDYALSRGNFVLDACDHNYRRALAFHL